MRGADRAVGTVPCPACAVKVLLEIPMYHPHLVEGGRTSDHYLISVTVGVYRTVHLMSGNVEGQRGLH